MLEEPVRKQRQCLVLFFGYTADTTPKYAGTRLLEAAQTALRCNNITSSTQASVAKSRPLCLGQEVDCPAAEDILVLNVMASNDLFPNDALSHLSETIQDKLLQQQQQPSHNGSVVTLHGLRRMESAATYLHAEQSCTQHVFHFLLPVSWLPDAANVSTWYQANMYKPREERSTVAPQSLRQFKEILRRAESQRTTRRQSQSARFGLLAHREKRPWHNYADPRLRVSPNYDPSWRVLDRARLVDFVTDATYGNETDNNNDDNELYLVCEFCGDEFLQQQVRRIVGTAVATVHGWLPLDFWERSLDRQVLVATPITPLGHTYRATARFHYTEIHFRGKRLLDTDGVVQPKSKSGREDPIHWIRSQLVPCLNRTVSSAWLDQLRDVVTPRIRAQLSLSSVVVATNQNNSNASIPLVADLTPAPDVYQPVLRLLREMLTTNQWPTTSVARSTVIGNLDNAAHDQPNNETTAAVGSFTVVSTDHYDFSQHPIPLGNSLFPELTAAVFDLERSLVASGVIRTVVVDDNNLDHLVIPSAATDLFASFSSSSSSSSSHCAINCNAQFTPHVDSGRGAGQSMSTIVGLGDYHSYFSGQQGNGNGGALVVESTAYDIRYQPLQFDGWKLRHWTQAPWCGERFSLVWFTPEGIQPQQQHYQQN